MVEGFREHVGGDALGALGIRLLEGRRFTDADEAEAATAAEQPSCRDCTGAPAVVAIVNEAAARHLWPNEDAIGQHAFWPPFYATIVGVVANIQQDFQRSDVPTIYLPYGAAPAGNFVVKLRAGTSPAAFRDEADRIFGNLMSDLPPVDAQSMSDLSTRAFSSLRLALWLLASFAVVGALVAGLGVYASATLMAAERTHEMAIRAALGADVSEIRSLAFRRSVRVMCAALPVGLAAAWLLGRGLAHLLFQVRPADPTTYLISSGLLAVIVGVAGLVPAWRLAAADPIRALREE
jgi:putative ABC transport system permease protein